MKFSEYFAPTLRETPAEAETPSHQLLLRAGYIRKVGAGVYTYLPLAWRALRKLEALLRVEMERIPCHEMRMPTLVPRELMEETGRWALDVVYKLKDRRDAEWALGFTHEEVVTDLARRELRSWRDLPCALYQVQTKFRDEPRPRAGLIRGREFLMFDAYSFDRDEASMGVAYAKQKKAYVRFFRRLGLSAVAVEADGGDIGDLENHEFMVLCDTGEDTVLMCAESGYAANAERCPVIPADSPTIGGAGARESEFKPLELVSTPGARTIDEVSAALGTEPRYLVKSLVYVADGVPHLLLIRGDRTLNEIKVRRLLGAARLEMADDATVREVTGAPVGFAGPIGVSDVPVIADFEVARMLNFIVGGNQADAHYVHANVGRDFAPTQVADLRVAEDGDPDPLGSGGVLRTTRGIEVGHIFQLGTKYSRAMGVEISDIDNVLRPVQMGCYGIGITRTLASILEVSRDENGMIWPITAAPFEVVIVVAGWKDDAQMAAGQALHDALSARGIDVMLDEREERPGVKFKDADLIGYPVRVVIGKGLAEGKLELRLRRDSDSQREIDAATAADEIARVVAELKGELSGSFRTRREAQIIQDPDRSRATLPGRGGGRAGWRGRRSGAADRA